MLLGFVHDCMSSNARLPLTPSELLYVVELGAGSGKFSFFILKAVKELAETLDFPSQHRLCYDRFYMEQLKILE